MKEQPQAQPMRVCIVNEFFYPDDTGGTGTVLSELARTLRQDYGEVEIDVVASNKLYRDKSRSLSAYQEWNGIRIFRINTPHPGGMSAVPRLAVNLLFGLASLGYLLRRRRYDVLLIGTAPPTVAMAAALYRRLTGTPFVYVIYDLEPDRAVTMHLLSPRNPLVPVLRRSQRSWLHTAGKVVVLGRCMRDYVNRNYGLPPDQVAVIPIGSDPEEIRPLSKKTRFRAAEGLTGFVVCYSGNFGRYHNFDTILDAAKELHRRQAGITFVLVGNGAQKAHITRRVTEEGIENVRLHALVPKADYSDLLASADASLVTLEPGMEGLCVPSKFYSILASGRPTIAMVSPVSEVAQVIDESGCGVHIAQGDTQRLTDVLLHLSQNSQEADAMGRRARATLLNRYSNHQIARQYYEVMQAVLNRDADMEVSTETGTAPRFRLAGEPAESTKIGVA